MNDKLRILVGLPTTSQTMKSATAVAIANTCTRLTALGHAVDLHNIDSAEIVTARDMFANMVLHSEDWDHLLFVDSDMRFEPSLIERMIDTKADVSGVAYVRRSLDLPRLLEVGAETRDLPAALARTSSFTFKPHWQDGPGEIRVQNGFCRAAAVGMGVAVISKAALRAMVDAEVAKVRKDLRAAGGQDCWSFFEILEVDGMRLGEDYSFCYRWTSMLQRELLVCVDEAVGHIGGFEYSARYIDSLTPSPQA